MLKYESKIETQVTLLAVINDVGSSMGLWLGISVFSIFEAISKVLWRRRLNTEPIFVTNVTNYIRGEKIAMWRNFGEFLGIFGKF